MIRLALEYGVAWWSSAERIRKLVTIKNLHIVEELRAKGEDVILFYPHFVGFEMCVLR
jgi:KDO2-lipid IV(A) lauroyltransferase